MWAAPIKTSATMHNSNIDYNYIYDNYNSNMRAPLAHLAQHLNECAHRLLHLQGGPLPPLPPAHRHSRRQLLCSDAAQRGAGWLGIPALDQGAGGEAVGVG